MNLVNSGNKVLSNWYLHGNKLKHKSADSLYNLACYFYKVKHKPNEESIQKMMKRYSSRYSKENKGTIRKDIEMCWMKYGFSPDEYFMYHIYDADDEKRKKYISDVDKLKIASILNDREQSKILSHKYKSYIKYRDFYKREVIWGKELNEEFIFRHPRFMVKKESSSRGAGIWIADVKDYDSSAELIEKIRNLNNVICEELIEQDERMAEFHPGSVNTLRVRTIKNVLGETIIWKCTLRTGKGSSVIDNAYTGGPFALVDPETGVVETDGNTESGEYCIVHPDSGVVFKGFQIPEWEDLKTTVQAMSKRAGTLGFVGWDLALSKKGWIMVEGNSFSQVATPQAMNAEPLKDELWDIVYKRNKR